MSDNKYDKYDLLRFAAELQKQLPRAKPHEIACKSIALTGLARRLHKAYETECNGPATVAKRARIMRLETAVRTLLPSVPIIFNRDPRAAPVKLRLRSGATNDFGGEGFCVPT